MTLLAIHGFTEDDSVWPRVLAPLGRKIRALLLPGHGWRPCPPTLDATAVAAEIASQLPETGGDLLGYSLGGRLALRSALDHPARVRRLVLIAAGPGPASPEDVAQRRITDERLAESLEDSGLGPFIARWEAMPALRPALPWPSAVEASIRARRLSHDPRGLAASLRFLGQGAGPALWDRLAELTVPVLLVYGQQDPSLQAGTAMARRLPHARLVAIPGAGHIIHREKPGDLLLALAGFLGREGDPEAVEDASIR
ncbi:putative 2-succinyl-6-hydroxy-2,4-cyclohexadiene-1-carboxylate synthase [Planctomycetota bacterium]|nr:putative 2-succinyl-6-hydroxy-2,4-cyclohexadiene-1-carboxylate synthase [Planctomycetota bacterium]